MAGWFVATGTKLVPSRDTCTMFVMELVVVRFETDNIRLPGGTTTVPMLLVEL